MLYVEKQRVEENLHDLRIKAFENQDHAKMQHLHHYQHEHRSMLDVHYFHHENYKLQKENFDDKFCLNNYITGCFHPTIISISKENN